MTPAEFLALYKEFESAPSGLVQEHIDAMTLEMSDSWGGQYDYVLGLKVADSLALSPFGRNARRLKDNPTTTYRTKLMRLEAANAWALNRVC